MSHPTLTPAEQERLEILAEECAEVVQAVTKILRHGYESAHPDERDGLDNRHYLGVEITDVYAAVFALIEYQDMEASYVDDDAIEAAAEKKLRYSHHQEV